ncbi:cellulose binding domain-containing protein [Phytohabitans sp. LJ34]|uniref:cellulose binding domain-containing protein n=1 Tax=Phytohabitans sp. LJ34 TaxID=3452217 RepID=UPI003F88A8B3
MSDQPLRPGRVRRLVPWLAAVLVAVAGTLAVATPSHAATSCAVAYHPVFFKDRNGVELLPFQASVDVTNTGNQRTTGWKVRLVYNPDEYTVNQVWNTTQLKDEPRLTFGSVAWNAALNPGGTTNFGFIATRTSLALSGIPTSAICTAF